MTLPRNDRVKIWSAGVFPPGVTPEPLTDQQQPVQRNPLVADAFRRSATLHAGVAA